MRQPPVIMLFVLTNENKAAAARIGARRALRERSALMGLIRSCFARTQTWLQAGKYMNALVSGLPTLNGWTIAEQAGDRSPTRVQRLLNRASWDEVDAMSQVRRYAAAGLDAAARRSRRRRMTIGALDETGQEKQGSSTSGVKRLLGRNKGWEVRSAGAGSKGERWYAWAWLATASPRHSLLVRRHLKTGDIIFYTYPGASEPHHVVIYLGGDRIFQAPETGQDLGYGTLSEFTGQIASVRRITEP